MLAGFHLLLLTVFPLKINEHRAKMSQNLIIRNVDIFKAKWRFINDIRIAEGKRVEIDNTIQKVYATVQ